MNNREAVRVANLACWVLNDLSYGSILNYLLIHIDIPQDVSPERFAAQVRNIIVNGE
jgi:hypothetical protein